jgi:Lipid A 3-O-deacylase (PagL)
LLNKEKLRIYTRMGFGIAYLNKIYDRVSNPTNVAIGTHFNNYTTIGLQAEYNLSPQVFLQLSGHFAHSSNGHLRYPNLGLNTATARLGILYQFQPTQTFDTLVEERYKTSRKPLLGLWLGLGSKDANMPKSPSYPLYTITPHVIFPRSVKRQWSTGMEFTYDSYVKEFAADIQFSEKQDVWRISVFGAHEWLWGRFAFPLQLHLYADRPFKGKDFYYTKLGPKIYILPPHKYPRRNIYTAITLKAHGAVAEYVELSIGGVF